MLFLALAACTRPEAPTAGPRLAVEGDADLGAVPQGAPLSYTFDVRNEGGRRLRLEGLRTGCDCTATAVPEKALEPGEAGTIALACDSALLAGPQRRTVTVYTNDAVEPAVSLALRADVVADIAPLQREFYFGTVRRGERTARDLRLRLGDPTALPRRASSLEGHFDVGLERRSDEEWRVILTARTGAPAGVVSDRIAVETASPRQPHLLIPVLGRVEGGEE